jgi:hypothetical protein
MAKVDDFIQARALSIKELKQKDIKSVAQFSGAILNLDDSGGIGSLTIKFLNKDVIFSWPDLIFSLNNSKDQVPIQEQVLLLHYLNGTYNAGTGINKGGWISFQDLPDGRFYMNAFLKRAKEPLMKAFSGDPQKLKVLALRIFNASTMEFGDYSVLINALPKIPVVLVLWQGDDEFPAEGNILFNSGISSIFSAEDIAWLAGMVVYPLVGRAKE